MTTCSLLALGLLCLILILLVGSAVYLTSLGPSDLSGWLHDERDEDDLYDGPIG